MRALRRVHRPRNADGGTRVNGSAGSEMILWRPVGLEELLLIYEAYMRAFPPRLPEQPIYGVEIDYTSNELGHALAGILAGNGNFIERILGRTIADESPLLHELRPLMQRSLSRRVYRHYHGFARNQLAFLEKEPTVKKLLYVLRTMLTGVHLLNVGELEADLTRLMDRYDVTAARDLVERKKIGETAPASPALLSAWRAAVERLFAALDLALRESALPVDPPNHEEVRDWLVTAPLGRLVLPRN
jgi:predicted nucleotidyltransferase